ncbi:ProQ (plasmid) [Legionella adelaidensis]|uniref:ProQ n=1 Tax=Legionella adelaidensis TaxID=45056 RepID=A0A0W0R0V2_9GAMM|nr:ProQ/FinO family protein [Legionella adelaidensis]KTC64677.1 ProQ [Legionella adelaidensis]VEH86145.1 ProQ [Legionella adelaidensis]
MRKQELHPRTATINKKQKSESKKYRHEALTWLAKKFPLSFDNTFSIQPLKLGIMNDILQFAEQAAAEGISKSKLREAVVIYTRRIDYLTSLKAMNKRIDLYGNSVDEVTVEEAQRAAEKIKKRIEKSIKNSKKAYLGRGSSKAPATFAEGYLNLSNRPYVELANSQQNSVVIKHKISRNYNPSTVARLKEKLGIVNDHSTPK